MGREVECSYHWQGHSGTGKALLEAEEIILRGAIKARIPRTSIFAVETRADDLILMVQGTPLVLQIGEDEASRWIASLRKPRPSLAQKLGISAENSAYLIGTTEDPALLEALRGAEVPSPEQAGIFVAVLHQETDLLPAMVLAKAMPRIAIWCVHGKGRDAAVPDAMVRNFMYANAYRDSKSCAISADWTATRYGAAQS